MGDDSINMVISHIDMVILSLWALQLHPGLASLGFRVLD